MYQRLLLLCAFSAFGPGSISAQQDTSFISIGTEQGTFENVGFMEEYDFVFLNKEPLNFWLKWNAGAALPVLSGYYIPGDNEGISDWRAEVDVEVRAAKAISLNGTLGAAIAGERGNFLDYVRTGLEARYYLNRAKGIKQGKKAPNLTGTYFSLAALEERSVYRPSWWEAQESPQTTDYYLTARLGVQQRIFRFGYFDYSVGLGALNQELQVYSTTDNTVKRSRVWKPVFNQRIALGWAFGSPRPIRQDARTCDLFKCYREEKRMLKVDLLNVVRSLTSDYQDGQLSVAYEQKIGDSPFSVQFEGALTGRHEPNRETITILSVVNGQVNSEVTERNNGRDWRVGGLLAIEPRWYFLLKQHIASGRSGNNLNGMFVGLHTGWGASTFVSTRPESYQQRQERREQSARVVPLWGIQYRLFDHGFIEYRLGTGLGRYSTSSEEIIRDEPAPIPGFEDSGLEIIFFSALRIGLAF
jgi:hypothetical protein